jgi:glycosyltransferase involved in cell wall biosynthesis
VHKIFPETPTIVLPWRTFFTSGGITTFTWDLAKSLAAAGYRIHILAESKEGARIEVREDVTLHALRFQAVTSQIPEVENHRLPEIPWAWSATALARCRQIALAEPVHVVEAPIWDGEGIAFLLDGAWPLVTSLHTTMSTELKTHPLWNDDPAWMDEYVKPTLAAERELMRRSDAIRANSAAIVRTIESDYEMAFDLEKTRIIPHGLCDVPLTSAATKNPGVHVFFIGRFDARKGIDLLLRAIPALLGEFPDLFFTLAGNHCRPGAMMLGEPDDTPYRDAFLARHADAPWLLRVSFPGEISDNELLRLYADCDIFCGPSRFESFGLVFVEAMRAGKPVVACKAGGIQEVVADGETGLLIPPGDVTALQTALRWMIRHPGERQRMGQQGRKVFESSFSAALMAEKSRELYATAIRNKMARA